MEIIPAFRTVIATTDGCYPRENSSIISSTTPKLRYTLLFNRVGFDDGLDCYSMEVCCYLCAHAKNRAEMLNSNKPPYKISKS